MAVKKFKVEIEVRETATKTTTIEVEARNATMARGIAEYKLGENPEEYPFDGYQKELAVLKSRIVK